MGGRPLTLAVFDVDGTLVDSLHIIWRCLEAAYQAEGLTAPPPEQVKQIVGLPLEAGIPRLSPDLDPERHQRLAQGYRAAFPAIHRESAGAEALFPGIAEALRALDAAGILLGVATGKGRNGLRTTLERHGLYDLFVTRQTGDIHPGKPDPAMLRAAIAEAGAEAAQTVMIGDTSFDMEMARAAGAHAIGVAWGYHPPAALHGAGAATVVADVPALMAYLDQRR